MIHPTVLFDRNIVTITAGGSCLEIDVYWHSLADVANTPNRFGIGTS
jgi:hypothetical protein